MGFFVVAEKSDGLGRIVGAITLCFFCFCFFFCCLPATPWLPPEMGLAEKRREELANWRQEIVPYRASDICNVGMCLGQHRCKSRAKQSKCQDEDDMHHCKAVADAVERWMPGNDTASN